MRTLAWMKRQDWDKQNKRTPTVIFRVTAENFAALRSAGRLRKPKVSPHVEAKMRLFP